MIGTCYWRQPLAAGLIALSCGIASTGALAQTVSEQNGTDAGEIASHVLPEALDKMAAKPVVAGRRVAGSYDIGAGDKLRIKFFQREELSGEYRVRADGMITLPLIGSFNVAGHTPVELEQQISAKFYELTSRSAFAIVDVIERRPFFVSGDVNQPGTFQYVPHMTVVHAVAIAGGLYRMPQAPNQMMSVAREQWRLRSTKADAAVHLAKRERIKALLNREEELTFPPLIEELVGDAQGERIRLTQRRLFEQSRKWRHDQTDYLKTAVRLADEEMTALRTRLNAINDVMKLHDKELSTTQDLLKRGLTQRRSVYRKQYDISNMLTSAASVEAEIKRAEMKRAQAIKAMNDFWPDQDRQLADELAEVEALFEASMRGIDASSNLIGQALGPGAQPVGLNVVKVEYRILRRTAGGIEEIAVRENDQVMPGDVLKVVIAPAGSDGVGGKNPIEARAAPEAVVPSAILKSADRQNARSRAELSRHIGELKKLVAQQSSILSTVAKSQVDLAKQVEEWRARYLEVLESREPVAQPVVREVVTMAPVEPVEQLKQKPEVLLPAQTAAVAEPVATRKSVIDGRDGPDVRLDREPTARVEPVDVVLPEKGPASQLNARKLAMVLQTELLRIGCYAGQVDGDWGPMSQSALREYSKATAKRLPTGEPSLKAFAAIKDHRGAVCARSQVATRLPVPAAE